MIRALEPTSPAVVVQPPLCVDLDGTLVSSDLLHESALLLVRQRPIDALRLPFWLMKGKAHLKHEIARRVVPNASTLPYRPDVLEFLHEQKDQGRRLVLTTASDERIAEAVADHLGIFDDVLASNGDVNLSSRHKLAAIEARYADTGFGYIGNSADDLPLWSKAKASYLVCPPASVRRKARELCTPERVFQQTSSTLGVIVRVLRPKQWVKNLLLCVPLLASHQASPAMFLKVAAALLAFSLCASAVYVMNDLLDIESDRQHPTKRRRPFAAGVLSISVGVALVPALLAISFATSALLLGAPFTAMLGIYLLLTSAYSLHLKKKLLLDVILLAALYSMRIFAGGVAVDVPISPWLLAFSMFFFLSLAFVKRYSELQLVRDRDETGTRGRCYMVEDLAMIESCGPAAGYMAVMVFCLYINSPMATSLYKHPTWLWAVCPLLLYWISRVWFMAKRRQVTDDPITFAIKDRTSILTGLAVMGVMVAASVL